jgi:hypothetical protein
MPRALPTPHFGDPLNLDGLVEHLPVIPPTCAANPLPITNPATSFSHPIVDVHIQDYVKFQVNSAGANFSKWRQIFRLLLTMYQVVDHVTEGAAPRDPDGSWRAVDIHISLWFMSTLTDDLHRLVQGPDATACNTWTRLHHFFYDNQTSRYLFLSKAFGNTPRGDISISK